MTPEDALCVLQYADQQKDTLGDIHVLVVGLDYTRWWHRVVGYMVMAVISSGFLASTPLLFMRKMLLSDASQI